MTSLERRCRLLLLAYPAEYRHDRGEEIIGTLLEATPAGRSWPPGRDARSLFAGGLRARAALNRRRTTAANLLAAVLIGATGYLAFIAAADLAFGAHVLTVGPGRMHPAGWQALLVGAPTGLAVVLAWCSRRRAVVLGGVVVAAAAVSLTGSWQLTFWSGWPIPELACLAALALLARRGERPGRAWLWPVALLAAVPSATYLPSGIVPSMLGLVMAMAIVSLLWAVIDARPALALAVFLLALFLPAGIASLTPPVDVGAAVPLLIVIGAAAGAIWRLRRQSARVTPGREH